MELEKQVVSLELAKKLKELNVTQESLFIWQQTTGGEWYVQEAALSVWGSISYPTFTVAELGEMLPRCYMTWATPQGGEMKWWCRRMEAHFIIHEETPIFTAATEADVRAKMLIHLKEKEQGCE